MMLAVGVSSAAIQDEVNVVTISNQTGNTINYLFVSPGDSGMWGPDVLDSETVLGAGGQAQFYVHYPEACGLFDFMAIDADGASFVLNNQQVCDGTPANVTITKSAYDGSRGSFGKMGVQLQNDTFSQLDFIFVSPNDSAMIGVDMLNAKSVLPVGNAFTLIVPREERTARYQVISFGNDGSRYDFSIELNFSQNENDTVAYKIENSDRVQ